MSTLGKLENLEVLKLKDNALQGELRVTEDGGFHNLKALHIGSTNLATKGSGFPGFKREAPPKETSIEIISSKEEDYDFLKEEGRKQTEEILQKALARVKSMVQYPKARD
ncbi:hypothetical protein ACH5RR_013141 [Cinchona calisaya]|uniref:Uncharacterized protein n=1 Tax=Cinchona calisaya TaxID=153742 RepID=A0ABD2ZZA0_9GENT